MSIEGPEPEEPEHPEPETPEPTPDEQRQAAAEYVRSLIRQELESYDKSLQKGLEEWMKKVETVLKTQPAPVLTQGPPPPQQGSLINQAMDQLIPRLMNSLGVPGGGGGIDPLSAELLDLQKRAFAGWMKQQIRAFSGNVAVLHETV